MKEERNNKKKERLGYKESNIRRRQERNNTQRSKDVVRMHAYFVGRSVNALLLFHLSVVYHRCFC
jgi:hypothetical protein